ncbi:MAG: HEPN domain-containing protein [Thaumarchaeota archaeon]|nr:HEPN domain-containing protein [Nitrososphaerota archaeon]
MTKAVDPSKATNYMIKAESSLNIAKIAITQQAYDNAVMSAVHSAINALDALTTFYLNKRSSGAHTDVLLLIKGIFSGQDYANIARQFNSLLSLKNASEYQPDLMGSDDAVNSVRWAERIINKVKDKLKK